MVVQGVTTEVTIEVIIEVIIKVIIEVVIIQGAVGAVRAAKAAIGVASSTVIRTTGGWVN